MPAAHLKGGNGSGHGSFPPRNNIEGSPDVFINGIEAHREGDGWSVHCNPVPVCHGSVMASGSATVFINGKAAARIGDPVSCGSVAVDGSSDVFIGG